MILKHFIDYLIPGCNLHSLIQEHLGIGGFVPSKWLSLKLYEHLVT